MGLLGIALPIFILYYSESRMDCRGSNLVLRHGLDEVVHGGPAKSLAVSYLGVGLFCHFRWLWGLCHSMGI